MIFIMKKLTIITYYEIKEYFLCIKKHFEEYHYIVNHYPLFQYAYDSNDKIVNYDEHLNNYLLDNKPDIVLWWFSDVPIHVFNYVKQKNPNIYFILVNFDDPYNFNTNLLEKAKIFNCVTSPCKNNINKYTIISGVQDTILQPLGYDPNYFYPIVQNKTCSIATILYNVNDYTKSILDNIIGYCLVNNKIFHIYGPIQIKQLYPDNYVGSVSYHDQYKIFNSCYVFINLHTNKNVYCDDIDVKALACKCLLISNNNLIPDVLDLEDNYLDQLDNILTNFNNYVDHINKLFNYISTNNTWYHWVTRLHIKITKHYFSPDVYKLNYNIISDNLWSYFLDVGIKEKHIAWSYSVPNNFQLSVYSESFNLVGSPEKIYLHWYLNGAPLEYINTTNNIIKFETLNITTGEWFKLGVIFNKITSGYRDSGLDELNVICKNNPRLDINNALQMYFDMVDS